MKRFYAANLAPDAVIMPTEEVARHMRKVMRIEDGEHIALFDGTGREFEAVVESSEEYPTMCRIVGPVDGAAEMPTAVTVYQAVLKGDRFDYAVQKAVEAGAVRIVPFLSSRCVKRPANPDKFIARAQRIAQEAARQCGRSRIPEIGQCIGFEEVAQRAKDERMIVAYEAEDRKTLRAVLEPECPSALSLVVGPEGGFAEEEVRLLEEDGAVRVSLGPRILRAETAAPYALAQISYACER